MDHKDRAHTFNIHTFNDNTYWSSLTQSETPYLPSSIGPGSNKVSASSWSVRIAAVPEAVQALEEKPEKTWIEFAFHLNVADNR